MSGNSDVGAFDASLLTGIKLDSTKTFKWTIENFNLICDNASLVREQKVEVKFEATAALPAMTLTFSLSHEYSHGSTFLNLNYVCHTHDGSSIPAYEPKLSYIDRNGRPHSSGAVLRNTPSGSWRIGSKGYVDPWIVAVQQHSGKIVLEFTWKLYRKLWDASSLQRDSWNKRHQQSKKAELLEMLNSGRLSDVKVVSSDGHEFQAHKLILQAGSEVFEAMFRHQMAESTTGVITLGDLSAKAVKFLLHFLYSNEMLPISADEGDQTGSDATFEEVFYLASKYGLKELTTDLEENIGNFCKEENAVYLLKLCKLYSLEKGKKVIFDVVCKNRWDVLHDLLFSQL